MLVLACSACTSTSPSLEALGIDSSITTTSISSERAERPDENRISDQTTIRNAVSSANLDDVPGGRIAWANPRTGSRGEISQIAEYMDEGRLCRRFQVSLESFQGIALHKGEACMAAEGEWWLRGFEAI